MTTHTAIRSGALRGDNLFELIESVRAVDRDRWLDDLLGFDEPPPDANLPRGAVPYLPCGVDEILTMVRDVPIRREDEFVDLGSGVGRVVILVALLTSARSHGIEIQEALARCADQHSATLCLSGVSFAHGNAAEATLDGSVFFLYSPFNGAMLAAVLRQLEAVARRRPIVVCTVGLEFRDVRWLRARASTSESLTIYDSLRLGVEAHAAQQ